MRLPSPSPASSEVDETTHLQSDQNASNSSKKSPSYQTIKTHSSPSFSTRSSADSATGDEETACSSPELLAGTHQDGNQLTENVKGVIYVLLLGRLGQLTVAANPRY